MSLQLCIFSLAHFLLLLLLFSRFALVGAVREEEEEEEEEEGEGEGEGEEEEEEDAMFPDMLYFFRDCDAPKVGHG